MEAFGVIRRLFFLLLYRAQHLSIGVRGEEIPDILILYWEFVGNSMAEISYQGVPTICQSCCLFNYLFFMCIFRGLGHWNFDFQQCPGPREINNPG